MDFTYYALALMRRNTPNPLPSKPSNGYSQPRNGCGSLHRRRTARWFQQKYEVIPHSAQTHSRSCTKSGHAAVHELHSIENKSHRLAIFSLTQFLKGVQQDRSLTVS
jgi:hypothetical protein